MRLIDKYIFGELINPFLFGIAIFTGAFVCLEILPELMRQLQEPPGMDFISAFKFFFYLLPYFLVFSFPLSTLLAALLAFGRLSQDGELSGFYSAGIGMHRIILGVLLFASASGLLTFLFSEFIAPPSYRANLELMAKYKKLPQNSCWYKDEGWRWHMVYVGKTGSKPNHFRDVAWLEGEITDNNLHKPQVIINAEEATYDESSGLWRFYRGFSQTISPEGATRKAYFEIQEHSFKVSPEDILTAQTKPEELNLWQLKYEIKRVKLSKTMERKLNELMVGYQLKLAIPFSCLVIVLIGAPLGVKPKRAGKSLGLGLALVIGFCYYIVLNYTKVAGELGLLSPGIAAWSANLLFALIGIVLILKEV